MNWESERDMAKDVEDNPELYEALADMDEHKKRIKQLIEEDYELLCALSGLDE